MNPNSFDQEIKDANANPETLNQGTVTENTVPNPIDEVTQTIDYQKKFSESAKEAQRLYQENKALQDALKLKDTPQPVVTPPVETTAENLYPGYEYLSEEERERLVAYTNNIARKAQESILKDPAIAYARANYAESKWEQAFNAVSEQHPELRSSKDEFKAKYFKANNVPENIESLLGDVAKIYLFDKAKEIGAEEERKKASRIETERNTGGDRTPTSTRSLEDWNRMAQENPAKFAQMSKEYHADLASGKI